MKKHSILLAISFLAIFSITATGQNVTVTSLTGVIVDTILQRHLAGDGVLLSGCGIPNIFDEIQPNLQQHGKFNGQTTVSYDQIGTFNSNGNSTFPFSKGLVMTTGHVSLAQGPNGGGSSSSSIGDNYYCDSELTPYANPNGGSSNNITSSATLEFYFIAMADTFSFNYIFASDEYPEFACSSFNDVFAFILKGLDPVTGQMTTKNVAVVPNTITATNPTGYYVAINTINQGPGTSGTSSNCTPPGSSAPFSQYYVANPSGIEYDGRTVALSAAARIMQCGTYYMKMSISNVSDQGYDSGVFIEESSFKSMKASIEPTWENDMIGGDTLIQHCRDLDLTFTMNPSNSTTPITINTDPNDNAVLGQDYFLVTSYGDTLSPASGLDFFYFQNEDTLVNVHVSIADSAVFPEGTDTKTATLYVTTQGCEGFGEVLREHFRKYDTITVHLRANDNIRLRDTAFTVCDTLKYIEVEQLAGTDPLFYEWIPATGIDHPDALASSCTITESGIYRLVASDKWGCITDTATVEVNIVPKPKFTIDYTPDHLCVGQPVTIQVRNGYTPDYARIYWTVTNDTFYTYHDSVATIHENLYFPGYYDITLVMESAPGCSDSASIPGAIHVSEYPVADFVFSPSEPENGEEVYFYNQSTGENITSYFWNFGDGSSSYEEEPSHAYHLKESDFMTVRMIVTNADGCKDTTSQIVPVEDNFAFYMPNSFTPNNDGHNDVFTPKVHDVVGYEFIIYARNGEMIFYTTNPDQGWDGTIGEKPAPQGVYVWKINYAKIGMPDELMTKTGTITLVR
jgi:gliding motility-associated-like protein